MEVTYKTMEDNSRNISLIGEVENSSRERALVAQQLETGFLTVRSGGFGSHQAPLVRTAEEFQTERNSCAVLQPVFGFQLYWLMMNRR